MNVHDKTERLELGNVIELRGNFTEVQREDGISYEADCYRTTNRTATFEQLHAQELARQAQQYLASTDYRVIKAAERGVTLDSLYEGETERREQARESIRRLS